MILAAVLKAQNHCIWTFGHSRHPTAVNIDAKRKRAAIDRGEAEEDKGPESGGKGCGIAQDLSPRPQAGTRLITNSPPSLSKSFFE